MALGNGPFRTTLKAACMASALTISGAISYAGPGPVRAGEIVTAALAGLAAVLAIVAIAERPGMPLSVRLFAPGRSRLREIVHVMSFFAFTDPGEVSWHAVDQAQGRRRGPSLVFSLVLYLCLVLPSAMMLDWIFARRARLTAAAILYLGPWMILRLLETRAAARAR